MAAKSVVSKAKKASIPLKKSATIKKEVSAPISKREEVLAMAKTYIEKGGSTPSKKIAALAKEEILAIASAATKAVPPSSASKKGKPLDVGKVVKEAVSATKAKVEFDESAVHELIKAATTKFAGKASSTKKKASSTKKKASATKKAPKKKAVAGGKAKKSTKK